MAAESKTNFRVLAPNPETERGRHFHINADQSGQRIVYPCGDSVVIRNLADPSIAEVFSGHKCKVTAAKFAPNGNWVASGDERGRVIIWAPGSHIKKQETSSGSQGVTDIDWSDDSKRVVAVGKGSGMYGRCFDWEKGNSFGEIRGHSKVLLAVAFKPNRPYRLATCGEDKVVGFHEGPPFSFKKSYRGHSNMVNCVRYSPDGSKYVSVGSDKKIAVMDGKTGELIKEFESKDGHTGTIYNVSWSPASDKFITSSADKTCKVWNAESGEVELTYTFGSAVEDMQVGVCWTATEIVSVSLSGDINILDPAAPDTPKRVIYGHSQPLAAVTGDVKNNVAYTGDDAGKIFQWDIGTGLATPVAGAGHRGGILAVASNADGSGWWSVGQDNQARFNTGAQYGAAAAALGTKCLGLAASPADPQVAVAAGSANKLIVLQGGSVASTLDVSYTPNDVAISPDGATVAVAGKDKSVHTYALAGGNLTEGKSTSGYHNNPIHSVAFSDDGAYIASGDSRGQMMVWNAGDLSKKTAFTWAKHTSQTTGICFAGGKFVSVGKDERLIQWNDMTNFYDSGAQVEMEAHIGGVFGIAKAATEVLTIGSDRAIRVNTLSS